jgi:hypothetical protein
LGSGRSGPARSRFRFEFELLALGPLRVRCVNVGLSPGFIGQPEGVDSGGGGGGDGDGDGGYIFNTLLCYVRPAVFLTQYC